MNYADKARLIHHARRRAKMDAVDGGRMGLCLYIAHHVAKQLFEMGERPIIQAGSASWQWDVDRGYNDNHFGFEWQGMDHLSSRMMLMQGQIPEMHVWVALLGTGEIIDGSTYDFPRLAKMMMNFDWNEEIEKPPSFLWQTAPLPDRCYYRATEDACFMAVKALVDLYKGMPNYLEHYLAEA